MKARKRFGQHFLVDQGVLDSILRAVRPRASDRLLEIGPGPGALTQRLYPTFSGPSSPASSGTSAGASSGTVATTGAGAGTAGLNAADAGAPAGAPDATEAPEGRFVAVEIDRDLVPTLQARYPHLHLVNDDILRVDLSALL
ncbi:MAG: rRNA adenine N-6-methyltransferase family protein, partial [Gammaproteobacteria bacterium]